MFGRSVTPVEECHLCFEARKERRVMSRIVARFKLGDGRMMLFWLCDICDAPPKDLGRPAAWITSGKVA